MNDGLIPKRYAKALYKLALENGDSQEIYEQLKPLSRGLLLKQDQWIIDGDYSRTYEMRFQACDTIFFINLTLEECLDGVQSRIGKDRPDIPWSETSLDPEFKAWIIRWFDTTLPVLKDMFEKYRGTRTIVTFNSRKEADEYLARLT